tara:strand:+ start:323 stop:628 length:306 start_codon:yes stop_codon:yes gene_type:complete
MEMGSCWARLIGGGLQVKNNHVCYFNNRIGYDEDSDEIIAQCGKCGKEGRIKYLAKDRVCWSAYPDSGGHRKEVPVRGDFLNQETVDDGDDGLYTMDETDE